jgi:hypothetical protein
MTLDNSSAKQDLTEAHKIEVASHAAQRASYENQAGAGVLTPKTGRTELPGTISFTPIFPEDWSTKALSEKSGTSSQKLSAMSDANVPAKLSDLRQIHPFTWMKKDSLELAQSELALQKDAGDANKLRSNEQKMSLEVKHLLEDLNIVKDRHPANETNYKQDLAGAHSELVKMQSDLQKLEGPPSGQTFKSDVLNQLSKDDSTFQTRSENLYKPALAPPENTHPPGDPGKNIGANDMVLGVNNLKGLKDAISSGVKFGSVRLWDDGVKINQLLNPDGTKNKNAWNNLEQLVDTAHSAGKSVMYTFGETRNAKGECVPPSDAQVKAVTEELTKWSADRKANGKGGIDTYELWNEPGYKGFWTGTPQQLAHTTGLMNQIIRQNDQNAKIASPANSFWGNNAVEWTKEYLAAYKNEWGLSSKTFDQIDFHGYGFQNQGPEQILTDISQMKQVEAQFGLANKPLVDSEDSFGLDRWMPNPKDQENYLARKAVLSEFSGVTPGWYAFGNKIYGGMDKPNQLAKDEPAVYNWMNGATLEKVTQTGNIYTATMLRDGKQEEIAWTTSSQPVKYTPSGSYTKYQTLFGETGNTNGSIDLSGSPILLQ